MQNYRVGSPLPTGTSRGVLASVAGPEGTLQLFSIGTNGHVFNIVPDASSDTGWSSIDMGVYSDQEAVEAELALFAKHECDVTVQRKVEASASVEFFGSFRSDRAIAVEGLEQVQPVIAVLEPRGIFIKHFFAG